MPDTIQILLLNKDSHGEITCRDCTIDTIYINDASKGHEFIGKYVATEGRGADTLVRYRTYKKIEPVPGELPLLFQAMADPENQKIFYHANPFMEITSISDDAEFQVRARMPF